MMTISVLLSVYKNEKPEFLARALASIWDGQTRKPNEIIVVEDGPIPDSLEIIVQSLKSKVQSEGHATFTIVKLPENGGLTKALNEGLKYVTGDLIARMDSDDISATKRFEMQVEFMEKHPEIDILGGSLQEFDETNECLNIRHYPLTYEAVCKYIVKACPLAHPSVMMRKRIFDKGLRYDERYRMSQDIKLWFDAILAGYKIGNIPEVLLYFRRDGDVFKRRSRVKAKNEFKIYMNGIYRMHGLWTTAYRFPIARYIFRNMPTPIVKWIYGSKLRNQVLKK
jgi:glycosyltransferase involved in cell wall biosynthesis